VVDSTPWLLIPGKKIPVATEQEAGSAPELVWTIEKRVMSCPSGDTNRGSTGPQPSQCTD